MVLLCAQAFLPQLGTDLSLRGRPGKILNSSSIYGSYALPFTISHWSPISLPACCCMHAPATFRVYIQGLGCRVLKQQWSPLPTSAYRHWSVSCPIPNLGSIISLTPNCVTWQCSEPAILEHIISISSSSLNSSDFSSFYLDMISLRNCGSQACLSVGVADCLCC